MQVHVTLGGDRVEIEREVLVALLDNSVASERAAYRHALENGEIKFTELVEVARVGNIPLPLFFTRRCYLPTRSRFDPVGSSWSAVSFRTTTVRLPARHGAEGDYSTSNGCSDDVSWPFLHR